YHLTYELTINFAQAISRLNTGMTICYVTGAGTDSTEKGKSMWARVKGKTENDVMKLPFRQAYMFRPGFMYPVEGQKHTPKMLDYLKWLYPVLKPLMPGFMCTLKEVGLAMINTVNKGPEKNVLEVKDIVELAKK